MTGNKVSRFTLMVLLVSFNLLPIVVVDATTGLLGFGPTPDPVILPNVGPGDNLHSSGSAEPAQPSASESFLDKLTGGLPSLNFFGDLPCLGQSSLKAGKCIAFDKCAADGGFADGKALCLGETSCCVKPAKCGDISLLNNTVFANPGFPQATTESGQCSVTIKKPLGIVAIKLIIQDLELAPPEPKTGECNIDAFWVEGGVLPGFELGKICGVNGKTHLFFPTVKDFADIKLRIALSANDLKRRWLVRAELIEEKNPELPPPACTQFFTESSGVLTSLNFNLANGTGLGQIDGLKYLICIRQNPGFCSLEFDPIFFDLGHVSSHSKDFNGNSNSGNFNNNHNNGNSDNNSNGNSGNNNPLAAHGRLRRSRPSSGSRPNSHRPVIHHYGHPLVVIPPSHPVFHAGSSPKYHQPSMIVPQMMPYSPFLLNLPMNHIYPYLGGHRPWAILPHIYPGHQIYKPLKPIVVSLDHDDKPIIDDKLDKLEGLVDLAMNKGEGEFDLLGKPDLPKVCPDQDVLVFPLPDDGTSPVHCGNDLHFGSTLITSDRPYVIKVLNKGKIHGKGFALRYRQLVC